jgi:ribosome assembly protein RRB1
MESPPPPIDDGNNGADDVGLVQSWPPLMGETPPKDLEMDPSAYKMYHTLAPEWPSLSFDFLRDDLKDARQRFPHSLQAVIGTQADEPDNNQLTILKLSDLSKLPQENDDDDILGDKYDMEEDDDDESSPDEEDIDFDPVLENYHLSHYGAVNRLQAMPQQSDIIATWSDVGKVYLYNVEHIRSRFSASEGKHNPSSNKNASNSPFFTHSEHGTEGYALDWLLVKQGHLETADNNGKMHLWTPRPDGGYVTPSYESVGGESVEDLRWSPSEATVFAEPESGGHIAIYDTRAPNWAMLRHCAHNNKSDVNVYATGGDDGTLNVWDLRHFSSTTPSSHWHGSHATRGPRSPRWNGIPSTFSGSRFIL